MYACIYIYFYFHIYLFPIFTECIKIYFFKFLQRILECCITSTFNSVCYLPYLHNCLLNLLAISQWTFLWKPFKYVNHEISIIYHNNIAKTRLHWKQIKAQNKQVSPKRCAQMSLPSKDINLNSSKSPIALYSYDLTIDSFVRSCISLQDLNITENCITSDQVLQVWSTHTSIRSARLRSEDNQIS